MPLREAAVKARATIFHAILSGGKVAVSSFTGRRWLVLSTQEKHPRLEGSTVRDDGDACSPPSRITAGASPCLLRRRPPLLSGNRTREDAVADYRVVYFRQGSLADGEATDNRDVHEYTVQVERDGLFQGEWIGTIDAPTLYTVAGKDVPQFHRNAVLVVGSRLRLAVERGETLKDVGRLVPLSVEEVMQCAPPRDADWQPGDTVVEFEV